MVRAPPSWPHRFPKAPPPKIITFGVRISTWEFCRDTNISSIANPLNQLEGQMHWMPVKRWHYRPRLLTASFTEWLRQVALRWGSLFLTCEIESMAVQERESCFQPLQDRVRDQSHGRQCQACVCVGGSHSQGFPLELTSPAVSFLHPRASVGFAESAQDLLPPWRVQEWQPLSHTSGRCLCCRTFLPWNSFLFSLRSQWLTKQASRPRLNLNLVSWLF